MSGKLHANHRQRLRNKYLMGGAEILHTHELLEMLLFNSIAQQNTNDKAHGLINMKNDIGCDLISADCQAMQSVKGIGEKSALLVRTSIDTTLRLLTDRIAQMPLDDEFAKRMYLYMKLAARREKCAVAVMLNRRGNVICCVDLARGPLIRSEDVVKEVCDLVRTHNASSVIISHNHKNNVEEPSVEDYFLTGDMESAAERDGFGFAGHYIVTDQRCVRIDLKNEGKEKLQ